MKNHEPYDVAKRCDEQAEIKAGVVEEVTLSQKIRGFLLSLILVPLLFVGTCVPFGLVGMAGINELMPIRHRHDKILIGWFAFFGLVFLAVTIRKAVKTENPGSRLAIVLWSIALFTVGLILLFKVM